MISVARFGSGFVSYYLSRGAEREKIRRPKAKAELVPGWAMRVRENLGPRQQQASEQASRRPHIFQPGT